MSFFIVTIVSPQENAIEVQDFINMLFELLLSCHHLLLHNLYSFIIATSFAGIGVLMFIIYCFWRKLSSTKDTWKKENLAHQNVEAFLRNSGPLVISRYSYSDVKTMTKSFNDKLGQGGYGSVYKGKLQDGCFVAVKVLNNSKGNGEEFINEVASISRTSHVTLSLLRAFALRDLKELLSMSLCLMDLLRSSYIKEILQVLIVNWGGKHYTRFLLALHEA